MASPAVADGDHELRFNRDRGWLFYLGSGFLFGVAFICGSGSLVVVGSLA
jgi:hypothetical protein